MFKEKKILIVDDDERNIFALSAVLKPYGPIIYKAKNGIECLKKLKANNDIDLVLLDMMMPKMDGYETLQEIRRTEELKNTSVISITAQAMKGDKEKCIQAGANEYCSKPIEIDHLIKIMKKIMKI